MDAIIRELAARDPALDLNDVALLVRVVQTTSFSAAAKERGVPVSTVSRRIARLEARLGTRLLERTTRRLRLTDVGRTYFAHAERALEELTEGSRHVRAQHAEPRGRVRLTAPVGLGVALTTVLAPYLSQTPLVSLDIDLTDRKVDLESEDVDIALRSGPIDSAEFVARKVVEATRCLYAAPAYLEERGRPERVADLSRHDLIAMHATATGAVWELAGAEHTAASSRARKKGDRRHRLAFKPRLCVNELKTAKHAARSGIGIALLPAHECAEDVDKGLLERVLPDIEGPRNALWLLYRAHRGLTAAVRSCALHLVEHLPPVLAPKATPHERTATARNDRRRNVVR